MMARSSRIVPIFVPITTTTTIDIHGDLTLIVTKEEDGQEEDSPRRDFLVCSRTLARSSDYFETLLYGVFEEAKGKLHPNWTVTLRGDDPDAFKLLLDITHGRYEDLPEDLDDKALLQAIVVADKYGLFEHFRRHAHRWTGPRKQTRHKHARERRMREETSLIDSNNYGLRSSLLPVDLNEVRERVHLRKWIGSRDMVYHGLFFYAWHCRIEDGKHIFEYWQPPADAAPGTGELYTNTLRNELEDLPDLYIGELAPSSIHAFY